MKLQNALIVTLLSVLLAAILVIGTSSHVSGRTAVRDLSCQILEQTSERIEQHVDNLFDMASRQSTIAKDLMTRGRLDPTDQRRITEYFVAAMKANPELTYLSFGHQSNGDYCHVFRDTQNTLTIRFVRSVGDRLFTLADYRPGASEPHWTKDDHRVDIRQRPYYTAAVEAGGQTWTETYVFIGPEGTPDTPGVTCATPVYDDGELVGVLTADFDIDGLSSALAALSIGDRAQSAADSGLAFIVERRRPKKDHADGDARRLVVVAHPDPTLLIKPTDPDNPDEGSDCMPAALIGDERVHAFLEHLPAGTDVRFSCQDMTPIRFSANGARYIGGYKQLGGNRPLDWVICMAVPEADVMADVWRMDRITTAIGVASVLVAVLAALFLSRRISHPIETLVRETDRIRGGDFGPGAPMPSRITEVRRLAAAHDRMRVGLRSLVKIEHELQAARHIQQSTLPEDLPHLGDFEVEAWNEPAEETGGDTYDMVECRVPPSGGIDSSSVGSSNRAILLLADASGHGVGPALSVTEVRAMLRMAVRMQSDIRTITRHINEQLRADLPVGVFVTAWLGELNATKHTLTTFSAGQAPLLHYDAGRDSVDVFGSDSVPLGILDDLDADSREPLVMNKGDIFAVISDGVFEALDGQGRQFTAQRVIDVITANHRLSAGHILAALRQALAQFTEGAPAQDDRTVLIIKRNGR